MNTIKKIVFSDQMVFFLLFAKSVNPSRRASSARLLLYLCTILIAVAIIFFVMQFNIDSTQSTPILPADISFSLGALFTMFLLFCGDAIRMTRKETGFATRDFDTWGKKKEQGARRFVLKYWAFWLSWGLALTLLNVFAAVKNGVDTISAIVTCLIIVGIGAPIAIGIWRLNMRYHDQVAALLKPSRASELGSLRGKNEC